MGFSVGETLASAVVKEAVNMIRVAAEREAGLLWSFKDDLRAMGDTLETINAALRDADAARGPAPARRDERTRLLLGRLKAAAQDIEDLLEEFADAGTRRRRSNWSREVNWLTNMPTHLKNLVNLELANFIGCDQLPPLGRLEKLRSLTLRQMPNLKIVPEDIISGGSNGLSKLQTLKIESMPNLERWMTAHATTAHDTPVRIFPDLQLLKVYDCPKVKFVPFLPVCSKCIINASSEVLMSEHENEPPWDMPTFELSCLFLHTRCTGLQYFRFLRSLSVLGCKNMSSWEESIVPLTSLQKLELCQSEMPGWLCKLSSLRELHIIKSKTPLNLSQFVEDPHQITLRIEDCQETLKQVPSKVILGMMRQITIVEIVGCEPIMHAEWRNGELFKCKLRKSSEWYMPHADAGSLPTILGTWQEEPTEFRSGDTANPDHPGPSGTK